MTRLGDHTMTSHTPDAARSHWSRNRTYAIAVLVTATAIWGSTFAVVDYVVQHVPVHTFLSIRFTIAVVLLLAIRPRALRGVTRRTWTQGLLVGFALGVGYYLQTQGQALGTQPTIAAFITGLFVVITPLLAALLFKARIGTVTWVAIGTATIGLAALTLRSGKVDTGALFLVGCAAAFAVQIVLLSRWSTASTTVSLVAIQLLVVAVGENFAALAVHGIPTGSDFDFNSRTWLAIGFLAVFATVLCYLAQTWAQSLIPATAAAVILTAEPMFASITGAAMRETVTAVQIVGAALVLAAMYLVELAPRRAGGRESEEASLPHLEP